MKSLSLLGSTGSIGTQTLDVLRALSASGHSPWQVSVLAAHSNTQLLEAQAREFRPRAVALFEPAAAEDFRHRTRDLGIPVLSGMEGLCEAAAWEEADLTLNAVVGMVGLRPTLAAIAAGKTVALANKETLVAGGALVTAAAREKGVAILPVDSEHSAIFQCLRGNDLAQVKRLLLTASGGPFFGKTRAELGAVTPAQALRHPNWSMGAKVTIDSATMMNKGLEVMEARWLFDVPVDKIQVVVHRESIVHSMVEYNDGAVMAQLGTPDMRLPIRYALTYPCRAENPAEPLDLLRCPPLTFAEPDRDAFPCLRLAEEAAKRGGAACTVLNAANEEAVRLFLAERVSFQDIYRRTAQALAESPAPASPSLEDILEADRAAR